MCATILVPGGASGVAAKSNSPKIYEYAESLGFARELRRRFNVITACSIRRSHSDNGKLGSVDASPDFKWFLKVCIALSALFVL